MRIRGSIRLFRAFGIDVFMHWSWIVAAAAIVYFQHVEALYPSLWMGAAIYLSVFAIVLLHEFGHALATKSVGGTARHIVLWPLGGIAFVQPPPRPGPVLWAIAAGPLVNVALVPVTALFLAGAYALTASFDHPFTLFTVYIFGTNLILLIFNMLPVYPLDGGQILQSLLWFFIGRPMSLVVASAIGLLGGVALLALSALGAQWFLAILAAFILLQSYAGMRQGLALSRVTSLPRRHGVACPACHEPPPAAELWRCACGQPFDIFAHRGICPHCAQMYADIACPLCFASHPARAWFHLPPNPAPQPHILVPPVLATPPLRQPPVM